MVFTSQKAMSTFGYRRELSKYEELDEDELLASLTAEELQELEKELVDIEPDDKVPIGLRQRDQTVKTPTGTFSREALLKYWEKETRQILENERMGSSSPHVSNSRFNDLYSIYKTCQEKYCVLVFLLYSFIFRMKIPEQSLYFLFPENCTGELLFENG